MSVTMTQTLTDYTDIAILEVAFNKMGSGVIENTHKAVMKDYYDKKSLGIPDFFVNGSNNLLGIFIEEDGSLKVEGDIHYMLHGSSRIQGFNFDELKQRYTQSAIEQIMDENGFSLLNCDNDEDNNLLMSFGN